MAVGVASWVCCRRVGCRKHWVVARVRESIKNPVNVGLHDLTSSPWGRVLSKGVPSRFVVPGAALAGDVHICATARDRVKKVNIGGPRPPIVVARVFLCHLDRNRAVSAACSRLVVVVERRMMGAKHVNTCSYHLCTVIMVELRAIINCYIDVGRLCEPNSVKIIFLRALQVEIINGHVFTRQLGLV